MVLERLLIPLGPDQTINDSLHQALKLANENSSHVTLLTVIEDLAELREIAQYTCSTLDILDKATEIHKEALKQHVYLLKKKYANIKFQTRIRVGIPFIEIIKESKETKSTMMVVDSHRESKEKACQRGSTTLHLMRKSEIPIWSISMDNSTVQHVVAAIDITNLDNQAFNTKIITLAIDYCSLIGARLTLCHVWRLESEGFLRKWSHYDDIDIALLSKKMRSDRVEQLKSLLAPLESSSVVTQIKILEGDTREVLPQYISNNDVDLMILGSLSRTNIAGFLMGNTAESMLNQLSCSVLTIKPDSFKSPVFE